MPLVRGGGIARTKPKATNDAHVVARASDADQALAEASDMFGRAWLAIAPKLADRSRQARHS
jgi:hypothetical protein